MTPTPSTTQTYDRLTSMAFEEPSLDAAIPVEDPILVFGLAMVIFLTAPLVLQRYRLPGIVGVILVGALVGDNALGLLERNETIVLLGEVGLVYLLFVAGLEINLTQFVEYRDRSIVFGTLSFLVPQAVGTVVGYAALGLSLPAAALFASIFASHTLLAYPVVTRLGITKNESVTATIGGTILTDTLALLVLAVVVASTDGGIGPDFWLRLAVGLTVFFVGVWVIVPRIGRWFFRTVDQESYFEFLFVMAILFGCAYLAEVAGVEHIVGAFLAGLALNRLIPESGPLMNRIEFVGNALFIPFFLLSVGMLVDVRVFTEGIATLALAGTMIVLVFATKLAAAWLTAAIYDYSTAETMTMFGLSAGQAAAALAIVLIGAREEVGLFGERMINAVVLMILVVSVVSPAIVDWYGREVVRAEAEREYDPSDAPQRVLVPFSPDSRQREELLDLALIVRRGDSAEPLYTLTVASPGANAEAEIAAIEESLEDTEAYGAGAEVPVESQTRVEYNVASGIVRAALENRVTTLVIGWDGAASRRQRTFGDVIDRVLTRTKQLVLVARVREPINTTTEVVVLLPRGIDHNEGFYESVHTVKHVADTVGASIRAVAIDGNPDQFARLFKLVEPDVPTTVEGPLDWSEGLALLRDDVGPTQLVVAMSARRGTMGWHSELQTLPKSISTLTPGNFVVVYPATGDRADDRQFLQFR